MVGHDEYDASYYFVVPHTYDDAEYDWTQENWLMRCYNREARGMEHYGFLDTPTWIAMGVNLLTMFANIESQRHYDRLAAERRASR